MTVLQNPTLAQMTAALEHATTDDGSDFESSELEGIFHDDSEGVDAHYFIVGENPTLQEMRHFLEINEALAHYGIKGMKWGIRRSDRQLATLRDEEGEDIGGIRTRSRKDASTLKKLGVGQAVVIEDSDGSGQPMAVVKLKDGSFKKVHISADAQNAVRTLNKEQIEMSTREIKEAAARAKAIEDYNKYFGNRDADKPNADLQAAVERLQLEQKYAQAYSQLNPSRIERTSSFISKAAPIYDTYAKIDKASGGQMTTGLKEIVAMMKGTSSKASTATTVANTVSKKYGAKTSVKVKNANSTHKVASIKKKGS